MMLLRWCLTLQPTIYNVLYMYLNVKCELLDFNKILHLGTCITFLFWLIYCHYINLSSMTTFKYYMGISVCCCKTNRLTRFLYSGGGFLQLAKSSQCQFEQMSSWSVHCPNGNFHYHDYLIFCLMRLMMRRQPTYNSHLMWDVHYLIQNI